VRHQHSRMISCFLLLTVGCQLLCCGEPANAGNVFPADKETVHKLLRRRDSQFDNVRIRIRQDQHKTIDLGRLELLSRLKVRRRHESRPTLRPVPEPYDVTARYWQTLYVRGPELTIVTEQDPSMFPDGGDVTPWGEERGSIIWSNRGGARQALFKSNISPTLYRENSAAPSSGSYDYDFVQLALGIGLGKRAQSIDTMSVEDKKLRISGRLDFLWQSGYTFQAVVDSDWLVRNLTMSADVGQSATSILEVTTSGKYEAEGCESVARNGELKCYTRVVPPVGDARVKFFENFESEVVQFERIATDDEYRKQTSMAVPDGTIIVDRAGESKRLQTEAAEPGRGRLYWWLVVINLIVLLAVSLILGRKILGGRPGKT